MHERSFFQADIDERCLHAWQHLRDLSFINVADEVLVFCTVSEEIRHDSVIQHRHTGFFPCDRYRNFYTHTNSFRSQTGRADVRVERGQSQVPLSLTTSSTGRSAQKMYT